jgi:hypothetical protein
MDFLEESEEINEVYKLYGIAAHNCCNIEYRIAHLLLGPKWAEIEVFFVRTCLQGKMKTLRNLMFFL